MITITINPVNDAPVIGSIEDQSIDEDGSLTLQLSASDVDGDDLTFSAVDGNTSLEITEDQLTVTPESNFYGDVEISVSVSDGSLSDYTTFTLTVNPVNDAPVLDLISDQVIDEDGMFTYTLTASDIDSEDLYYGAMLDGNSILSLDNNLITITPDSNFNGSITVTYTVTDGDLSDSNSFILEVNPVNDAPVIGSIEDQSIDEDGSLTLQLSASDVDADDLTFSAVDGNTSLEITEDQLTVTPESNFYGDVEISVSVSDGSLSDSTTFTLTVNPVNDAPVVINTIDDVEVNEDSGDVSIDLSDIFYDVENGSSLSLTVLEYMDHVSANLEETTLTLSFSPNGFGSGEVIVSASDVLNSRLSVQTTFNVTVNPVNDAPVIADIENQTIDEDGSLTLDLSGSDVDGDALTFSASNGDSDISVDGTTLTITPPADYNGSEDVTVVVTDGDLSDSTTFTLTVNPVNDAPTLDDLADASVAEDTDFTLELSGADVDGDALTFLASVDANGSVAVDGSTLTVSPASDYNGDITVSVIASDGQASGSGSFTLTVTPVK